jgi:peptide/nickel transport system substrate-binding protein
LLTDPTGQPLPSNPLRDLRVRRAISLSINRTALAERALDGFAFATGQLVPEGFGGGDPAMLPDPHDPAQARRLLAEAGFPQGLGLTVGCSNNRYVNDGRVCQALGQMLSRGGFQAKVEAQPGTVFFPRTQAERNDVPVILFGLSLSSTRDVQHLLATVLHSRNRELGLGIGNRGSFTDAELDHMIEAAMVRMDPGREEALREAMRRGVSLLGAIPLYNQVTIAVARRGIAYTPRMDEQLVAFQARPENAP